MLNLVITGVGGQGNVMASQIIGHAVVKKELKVSIGETFGLSQRGGAVMSHVRISNSKAYGPLIPFKEAHIIAGLEPLETARVFTDYGNKDTIVITNARPILPINVIAKEQKYPNTETIKQQLLQSCKRLIWKDLTEMALGMGNPILVNVIMLGILTAMESFPVNETELLSAVSDLLPSSKLALNEKALQRGAELAESQI